MQQLLETLNNLIPIVAIVSLSVFMTLEIWMPYFKHGADRSRQRWRNVGMIAIAFLINAMLGSLFVISIRWSETNNFGLLHRLLGQCGCFAQQHFDGRIVATSKRYGGSGGRV